MTNKKKTRIKKLTLTYFRNYPHLRLDIDHNHIVLTGPNGAGKTNVLEALSFLSPGRGLRRAKLIELSRIDPKEIDITDMDTNSKRPWGVVAHIEQEKIETKIGTGCIFENGSDETIRALHIDDKNVKNQSELGNILTLVWMTPQMDRLFIEGSDNRRRFLDRLVFTFDSSHTTRSTQYKNALKQRAKLLKEGQADPAWLSALEEEIASHGVAIAAARRYLLGQLNQLLDSRTSPFPKASLAIKGVVETWLENKTALEVETLFRDHLAQHRGTYDHNVPTEGPHRSDLRVFHLEKNMPAEQCSTGEQKALLLAIVLAHADLQKKTTGAAPILLLDEIVAHLDEKRRKDLFDEIKYLDTQAWLTGTDSSLFNALKNDTLFLNVKEGKIV